ncbi:2-dehydro-3-deoxyphosphogluconate aldolase/4-hydroxy-2-oxoglutarate aldolase [uncultured Desulfobacterium sp.]|uniref:2-dehydro-3-deoxyphosphogluconate aldolase/4-hydroxy-2-oxoglutarate aldolase n=1 Tax=uncultured Desulfobacterium sp. TaxID=201089 RepID=A0A445MRC5_9BACT|nr:2-dehydro-3-deoxyphosphogluconate aldolase/4-hydroxy-2-oxoglutarate aldolase [uncultured Desulfobacterium sp.]
MDISKFKSLPLLGILRGIKEDSIEPLIETVVASGLKTIEITMNTKGAHDLIRRTVKAADDRLVVGAGTVLTMEDLQSALDAGATFIVLPVLVADVVRYCAKNSIPVFPGAFTPQEVYNAWLAGATMVKVFPAGLLGPKYFAELKGPFNDIELLACGGVNVDTIGMFFSSGASAAAFGAGTFKKAWLEQRDFSSIRRSIEDLIEKIPI